MSDETLNNAAGEAVPDSVVTATTDDVDTGTPEGAEPQEPRTFTQEELDRIVAKEKAKVERRVQREIQQAAEMAPRQTPTDVPDPADFEDMESYLEAASDYKAEQKLAQREQQKQQVTVESTYAEREESIRDKYADFDDVAYEPTLKVSPYMAEVIKGSEIGPEIIYHLGKNPDESARISQLTPLQQARELGRIEASLITTPPVKKVTSAPEPITPGRRGTTVTSIDPTDPRSLKMDPSDWIKARNAQIAKQYK